MRRIPKTMVLLLAGLILAGSVGCAERKDTDADEQPGAPAAAALPPGVVHLTAAQQAAVGLKSVLVGVGDVPQLIALPAQIEVPTGRSVTVRAPVGKSVV